MSRFETLELTTSECVSRFTLFVCIEFNWNEMVWVPYRCVSGSIWLETCHRSGNKILHELFRMTCYHFQKKLNWKIHIFTVKFDSLHWLGSYDERNSHGHLIASSRKTTLLKHLDHQPLHYRYQPGSCEEKKNIFSLWEVMQKNPGFFNVSIGWLGFAGGWTPKHRPIVGDFTWAKFKNPPVTFHDTGPLIGILINGLLSNPLELDRMSSPQKNSE